MSYPSLIFTEPMEREERPAIPYYVYEDMKLTAVFSEAVIRKVMCCPCRKRDIFARQELFRKLLSDASLKAAFRALSDCAEDIAALDEMYHTARCPAEKQVLYLNLVYCTADFFRMAAAVDPSTTFTARFSAYFSEQIQNERFQAMTAKLQDVFPLIKEVVKSTYKLTGKKNGEVLSLTSELTDTYMSRLRTCAQELGVTENGLSEMAPKRLNASVIEATARLYPDQFAAFAAFQEAYRNFYVPSLLEYTDQLAFYLDVTEHTERLTELGIPVSYPDITDEKRIDIHDAYDITLLTKGETHIIPNDVIIHADEPFFYLTGANGGGKTTYLRTVGVSCLMALSGCPTPCREGTLYPLSGVYTHFPRDERFDNAGRSADEERRVEEIMRMADGNALILLNETYSTTSEETAIERTEKLSARIRESGNFGIYVTHQHGISETDIPFLNVVVDRSDRNRRTYKVERQRAVYGSLAQDILMKYALTKESLETRYGITIPSYYKTNGS